MDGYLRKGIFNFDPIFCVPVDVPVYYYGEVARPVIFVNVWKSKPALQFGEHHSIPAQSGGVGGPYEIPTQPFICSEKRWGKFDWTSLKNV